MCYTALDRFCLGTVSFEDPIFLALYSNDCMGNSIFKYYLADVICYLSISSFCADALRKYSWDMACLCASHCCPSTEHGLQRNLPIAMKVLVSLTCVWSSHPSKAFAWSNVVNSETSGNRESF